MSASERAARVSAEITTRQARSAAQAGKTFPHLGVRVKDGRVTTIPAVFLRNVDIGPLAGACAGVIGHERVTAGRLVASILIGHNSETTPVLVFVELADGTRREHKAADERKCRQEAAEFNRMADAVSAS